MASKHVWKLAQRLNVQAYAKAQSIGKLTKIKANAKSLGHAKPALILAAAPFTWDHGNRANYEEDDDDDDEDDEETESGIRSEMMQAPGITTEKYRNWSNNAMSHPQYRKTVAEAQRVLSNPPPPPPQFPPMPEGFCIDAEKVPPIPPTLPELKYLGFNNNSKLPASCPPGRPEITEGFECPAHLKITPKMPDMPFCDRPMPPPPLPTPPPCDELGPPPPSPPAIVANREAPPPSLPAPPPMSYELPQPPKVFVPSTTNRIPPLPCFPMKVAQASMDKCDNNNTLAEGEEAKALFLPPPPPSISREPLPLSGYWNDGSQMGMITPEIPTSVKKAGKKSKKLKRGINGLQHADAEAVVASPEMTEAVQVQTPSQEDGNQPEFVELWTSKGTRKRRNSISQSD